MGGKGSGNPNARWPKKNPVTEANDPYSIDKDANHWSIVLGKKLMGWEPPDFADPESVQARFYEYLDVCDELGMRPLVTGLAMAFGMNRNVLTALANGSMGRWKNITPESISVIKKCYDFMQMNWEFQLASEKGNPVKWIFLGKNHFGFRDQSERIVAHVDTRPQLPDSEDVGRKYAALVGREEPEYELPAETD